MRPRGATGIILAMTAYTLACGALVLLALGPTDPAPPAEPHDSQPVASSPPPDHRAAPPAKPPDHRAAPPAKPRSNSGESERPAGGKGRGTPDRLEFGGRVFVRDTLTGVDLGGDTFWREQRALDTARVTLVFRPNKRVRMDLEVDFAGDEAELKDTFVEYEPTSFLELKLGRFKRPVSFIGLESTWSLPRIDRGLLAELRIEDQRLPFAGGRGDGLAVAVELPGPGRPELTIAAQESELHDDLGLAITNATNQDVFGRVAIEPVPDVHLALAGGWVGSLARLGQADSYQHRPFASLGAFLDADAVRLWLEGMAGVNATAYVDGAQLGRFAAAQALIALRLRDVAGFREVEPYAALAWYEPSTAQAGDQLAELTVGVALWLSRHLRVQLEGGRRVAQDDRAASADATLIRIQVGAAFRSETEI